MRSDEVRILFWQTALLGSFGVWREAKRLARVSNSQTYGDYSLQRAFTVNSHVHQLVAHVH